MFKEFKVRDIPDGSILWKGSSILGIKGVNLPNVYSELPCKKAIGNDLDYELIIPVKGDNYGKSK